MFVLLAQLASVPQVVVQPTIDPTLLAAAVVTVLSSLGGTIVLIINAFAASKDRRDAGLAREGLARQGQIAAVAAVENNRKTDDLLVNTAKIHELTNSTNSNLQKALELMTEKNAGLERLLAQSAEEKKAAASRQVVVDLQVATAAATAATSAAQAVPKSVEVVAAVNHHPDPVNPAQPKDS